MPLSIREHVQLRDLTTFRVGGPARYFCTVTSEAELAEALAWARAHAKNAQFFVLGGGSNILISDAGFEGLVIKMEMRGISYGSAGSAGGIVRVTAGAGEQWDALVSACVERGLHGLENLSGIPGTVGAAPVQNIGAYGAEVSQTIASVRVFDTQTQTGAAIGKGKEKFTDISNADCRFDYRDSMFKHEKNDDGTPRYIIVSVTFNVKNNGPVNAGYKDIQEYFLKHGTSDPDIAALRQAVLAIRAAKLPDVRVVGTAGSFFKNPIVSREHFAKLKEKYPDLPSYPASSASPASSDNSVKSIKVPLAWILDHVCGYKGAKKGNVGTYKNQALVIVNEANATAAEIRKFAAEITASVKERTGIDIEPEVQYVG